MILRKNFFFPSVAEMIFFSIFLLVAFVHGQNLLIDCDTGYHIRAGEWILAHLSVPRFDIFSFHTPPIPWTAHEWLAEVIMAIIHRFTGLTGVAVFFAALIAFVSCLLYRMLRSYGCNILIAVFFVLLATATSQVHWLARPHAFSFLFFLVWLWILEEYRYGSRNLLFLLPPTLLLWVNLHGGYLAGFMLTGIYLLGELPNLFNREPAEKKSAIGRIRSLTVIILVCIPVACLNPTGYQILAFPFKLIANSTIMNYVSEFMSPNFHEPIFFKYMLLLIVAIISLARQRLRPSEVLLLIVFLNMSLFSARYIPLFALATAAMAARITDVLLENSKTRFASLLREKSAGISAIDSSAGGILWQALVIALVIWCAVSGRLHYEFSPELKPVAAIRFIEKADLPGNVFNDDEFGDYMIYAAWPRMKVFFDGRSDMYGTERLKEHMKVKGFEDGWERILEKYGINWIFIAADSPFARYLRLRSDWEPIYTDKVAAIFIRNEERNRAIIERYGQKGPGMKVSGHSTGGVNGSHK